MTDEKKLRLIVKILKDWDIDSHISEHIVSVFSPENVESLLVGLAKEILQTIKNSEGKK